MESTNLAIIFNLLKGLIQQSQRLSPKLLSGLISHLTLNKNDQAQILIVEEEANRGIIMKIVEGEEEATIKTIIMKIEEGATTIQIIIKMDKEVALEEGVTEEGHLEEEVGQAINQEKTLLLGKRNFNKISMVKDRGIIISKLMMPHLITSIKMLNQEMMFNQSSVKITIR